jgi:hypothetical protein
LGSIQSFAALATDDSKADKADLDRMTAKRDNTLRDAEKSEAIGNYQ